MTTFSESFNQADSSVVGPDQSWTEYDGDLGTVSNQLAVISSPAVRAFGVVQTPIGADNVYSEITVASVSGTDNFGPGVRCKTTGQAGLYFLCQNSPTNTYRLFSRSDGGSWTQIGSTVTGTLPSTPFTVRLAVSGENLIGYVNGAAVISGSSSLYSTNDKVGLHLSTAATIDSWEGGNDNAPVKYSRYQQRTGNTLFGLVEVSGNYTGSADSVDCRVLLASDDSVVVDWTEVDGSPAAEEWSGSVTVPAGGPYYIESRIIISSVPQTAQAGPTFICGDNFLVLGQSNVDARGLALQIYTGSGVAWLAREDGIIDETLNDPWSNSESGSPSAAGSFGPLLASLISESQGVPLGFIVSAQGGTGLSAPDADWLPPSGPNWVSTSALVSSVAPSALKGVLWFQGETDAGNVIDQATYQANEALLATSVANLPGAPKLLSGLIVRHASGAEVDPIRAAKIANWNAGVTLPGANPIDVDLSDAGGDGVHFKTNEELAILAARFWLAMEGSLYGGDYARGPIIQNVTGKGTSSLTLTFDRDLDTDDTTYDTTLFEVDNDTGSAVTVSTATRTGNRTVVLAMSGAVDGTSPTLTFASGTTPAGATMPRTAPVTLPTTINGISEIAVPAEPAYSIAVQEIGSSSSGLIFGPGAVYRDIEDFTPLWFTFPIADVSDDEFTKTKYINEGTAASVAGNIAFVRTVNGKHQYRLSYDANDRPSGTGVVYYDFVSGLYRISVRLVVGNVNESDIIVRPQSCFIPKRSDGSTIQVYTEEEVLVPVPVYDLNKQPVDLTGVSLWFGVWNRDREQLFEAIPSGTLTGFSVTIPKQVKQMSGCEWVCRRGTSGEVVGQGPFVIKGLPVQPA